MSAELWYVLDGTEGARNRARIVDMLDEKSRTVGQLADGLDVVPNTVRHHLDVLSENGLVEDDGSDYARRYELSDRVEEHRSTVEQIVTTVRGD